MDDDDNTEELDYYAYLTSVVEEYLDYLNDEEDDEDDDDDDDDWDKDEWEDEDDRDPIVCVRFPQDDGWSKKRYSYYTDSHAIKLSDFVIVNVGGEEKVVRVVATEKESEEKTVVTDSEKSMAKKYVVRKAKRGEVTRTRREYYI